MLPNLHILGIQGSGKGTQSSLLVKKYGLSYASSGNMFRERAGVGDDLGKEIGRQLQAGHLLPNQYLVNTVRDYLRMHPIANGLLGDGVIRTLDQYHDLLPIWKEYGLDEPFLIHLELDEETALERIEQRLKEQSDPSKEEYHRTFSGKLLQRTDDNPLAIQERFALFHRMTQPVINLFDAAQRCAHISAKSDVDTIHRQICAAIDALYPTLGDGAH